MTVSRKEERERLSELCSRIMREEDSRKFLELVEELIETLESEKQSIERRQPRRERLNGAGA
jgi:hypothetical protein